MVVGGGVVGLAARLGGEAQGDLLTAGLSDDGLGLVLADDLCDLNGLGDADFLGGGVGEAAGDLQGVGDQRDLVGLGLVLLTADLVFSLSVSMVAVSVSCGSTSSDLHGLGLVLEGDLGGGA